MDASGPPSSSEVLQDTVMYLSPTHLKSPLALGMYMMFKAKQWEEQTCGLVTNVGVSSWFWFSALEPQFEKPYFIQLCKFLALEKNEHTIYPPPEQVFSWTRFCYIEEVKVVILGQDPYHGTGQAHGLCFSVQEGIPPPPSLVNIYKALENDIEGFKQPDHGILTGWAKQGVLLLNAVLTVREHEANSHMNKGWETFTDSVITWINDNLTGVVFILWGAYAQKKGACIDTMKHYILNGVHPSPLSAHRGFFECKHFSKTNDILKEEGKTPIDWTQLPKS